MEQRQSPFWLGVDLGGTNIKAGVVDDQGNALSRVNQPTEAQEGPEPGVERICRAAREAVLQANLDLTQVAAIGVGSPGPLDLYDQILLNPHNLPGWLNVPLARQVGEQLGLPAVLQNDANAAAYGEFWAGAGRDVASMVQFTLGTGVGCGVVIDGQLLIGRHSHGAEAGHIRIALDHPRQNNTGLYGSLEAYASATSVVDRTIDALEAGEASALRPAWEKGERFACSDVFATADAGDALASRMVDQTAFYLAVGAVNLICVIDPDLVVFSGGMIQAGPAFLEQIRHHVRENLLPVPADNVRIEYATLGTDAGFIGAAGCARASFGTSP